MLTCTIFLDPRYKLDFVDYIFKKIEPIENIAEMKVERIQTQLHNFFFFSKYECPKTMATTNVSSCVGSSSNGDRDDHDEDMEEGGWKLHFVWYMLWYVF